MLKHPVLNQLQELKLTSMFHAFQDQLQMTDLDQLSFDERFGLLVDRELTERANRRLQYRLQKAKLRQSACLEDIDYRHPRGLDKTVMQHLLSGRWLDEHLNCLITGPTGVGKTWLACALAQGLPPRLQRTLPPAAAVPARPGTRPGRWSLSAPVTRVCENPVADPG